VSVSAFDKEDSGFKFDMKMAERYASEVEKALKNRFSRD